MNRKAMVPLAFAAVTAAMFMTSAPVRASETDNRIESSFKQTYVYKTYLKDDSISVDAEKGVVTLTGTVSEESHKRLARETVANLPGVTKVDNKRTTKAEAAAENADTWINRKVKLTLLFHRNVSAGNTTVEVKDGIVTLKGEASSEAQKELTAEYAKDIDGVKEVKNHHRPSQDGIVEPSLDQRLEDQGHDTQWRGHIDRHCQERRREVPGHQAG
jgi:hyperosmotically inducible protein